MREKFRPMGYCGGWPHIFDCEQEIKRIANIRLGG